MSHFSNSKILIKAKDPWKLNKYTRCITLVPPYLGFAICSDYPTTQVQQRCNSSGFNLNSGFFSYYFMYKSIGKWVFFSHF